MLRWQISGSLNVYVNVSWLHYIKQPHGNNTKFSKSKCSCKCYMVDGWWLHYQFLKMFMWMLHQLLAFGNKSMQHATCATSQHTETWEKEVSFVFVFFRSLSCIGCSESQATHWYKFVCYETEKVLRFSCN